MDEKAKIEAAKRAIEQPLGEGHESPHWTDSLDGRTRVHIAYARVYAQDYAHGAPGHLDLMTIAALAKKLDELWEQQGPAREPKA